MTTVSTYTCEARITPYCLRRPLRPFEVRWLPHPLEAGRQVGACPMCAATYHAMQRAVSEGNTAPGRTDRRKACCIWECQEERAPGEIYCAGHIAESREEASERARDGARMCWCVLASAAFFLLVALFAGCKIP
jgi:hypothetical protein